MTSRLQEIAPVDIDTDSSLANDAPVASQVRTVKAQDGERKRKEAHDVMIRDSLQEFVREAQDELNQV